MIKRVLLGALGLFMVILGVSLTLRDWTLVRIIFSGVIGPLLAVVGLVVLSLLKR